MSGTKAGGKLAAAKNLAKDPLFCMRIGTRGGKNGHTGGFASNHELAREAGRKGGKTSRRGKKKIDYSFGVDESDWKIDLTPTPKETLLTRIAKVLHIS